VRFAGAGAGAAPGIEASDAQAITALRIEGSIRQPADVAAWEYSVVVSIKNEQGKEIARKLIGVGAMAPDELRTFNLAVEVVPRQVKGSLKTKH
jgi:hypothetical protein